MGDEQLEREEEERYQQIDRTLNHLDEASDDDETGRAPQPADSDDAGE